MSPALASGQLFDCNGLVAVVTGGGSGLGAIMAMALARNGATVFILGRRLAKLQEIAQKAEGGRIIPIECDATDKEALESAVKQVESHVGFVNLLCVNHGITGPMDNALAPKEGQPAPSIQQVQKHFWATPMDDLLNVYKVNVAAVHFTAIAFLDLLDRGNKKGNVKQTSQVILTSSIAGLHRSFTFAGIGYNTSKAAVIHLGKSLAAFLAPYKIRINVLAPGIFPSELTETVFKGDMTQEGYFPSSVQPMTRSGRAEEIEGTLLYLASEAGGYVSGQVQVLDGGRLGVLPGTTY